MIYSYKKLSKLKKKQTIKPKKINFQKSIQNMLSVFY